MQLKADDADARIMSLLCVADGGGSQIGIRVGREFICLAFVVEAMLPIRKIDSQGRVLAGAALRNSFIAYE